MAQSSRVAGIFDLGDGEHFVVAEWFPDPRQIEAELVKIANNFNDWTVPLQAAKESMIESTRIHFETETDPYGDKWQALDRDYKHEKVDLGGFPDQILVREEALERAATSESAWFVDQSAIWFNAGALPFYGPIHQEGTSEGKKAKTLLEAENLLIRAHRTGDTSAITSEHEAALNKGAQGLNLPQRMFVGADIDTIAEIEAIFLQHMRRTIEVPWRTIGGGGIVGPYIGEEVMTTKGMFGTFTGTPAFGGGSLVRGESGRIIGVFRG